MQGLDDLEEQPMLKQFALSLTLSAASLAVGATAALAQTEIQWWHAMTGANNDVIVRLADEFNAAQKDYKVVPAYKGSYADTLNAGIAAFRAGNAPHIMQVFEVGTATMMGAKGAIKPVQDMMKEAGETFDPASYLPAIAGYYSTVRGEMLSFPFNSSSAVMWYNKDAFRKAGLNPDMPPKTWPEVFDAGRKLKAAGWDKCGFSTAWITWLNIEQLGAWHNTPIGTKANGMDGFDTTFQINAPLYVNHLTNLVNLQKEGVFSYSGRTNTGEGRFTSGECPIFLTSSAFFGNVRANAKFEWGNTVMPYYPEVAGAPQNSIIGGASLWVMGGKNAAEYKGVARFFTFLSDVDRQVKLHTESGYLPITKAAYAKVKATDFYKTNPHLETPLLQLSNKEPTANSRGLRFGSFVQIRDIWSEEYESALNGQKTPKAALDAAVERGNATLRQFERTVTR
jgi:sn-glycerol 3-phosphate transport system substrate-binding protein